MFYMSDCLGERNDSWERKVEGIYAKKKKKKNRSCIIQCLDRKNSRLSARIKAKLRFLCS